MLPAIYRKEDAKIRPNKEPLKRFLQVLSEGGFEPFLESVDALKNLTDIDSIDPRLLHLVVRTLGLDFPYNMTENERRKYLKIIPAIYKSKGTEDSFNFLAREIFSTRTNITTIPETYVEGMTPEEWRRIYIRIEVDGTLPDLQRKEENFRKFVEIVRPVNRILVISLVFKYFDNYRFSELVRDHYSFDSVKEPVRESIRTKQIVEGQISTQIVMKKPKSTLVTSQRLTTSFYTNHYRPNSLILNY